MREGVRLASAREHPGPGQTPAEIADGGWIHRQDPGQKYGRGIGAEKSERREWVSQLRREQSPATVKDVRDGLR
jgi:hypothetical protein